MAYIHVTYFDLKRGRRASPSRQPAISERQGKEEEKGTKWVCAYSSLDEQTIIIIIYADEHEGSQRLLSHTALPPQARRGIP